MDKKPQGSWFQLELGAGLDEMFGPVCEEKESELTPVAWTYTLTAFRDHGKSWTYFMDNSVQPNITGEVSRDYKGTEGRIMRTVPLVVQLYNAHSGAVDDANKARTMTGMGIDRPSSKTYNRVPISLIESYAFTNTAIAYRNQQRFCKPSEKVRKTPYKLKQTKLRRDLIFDWGKSIRTSVKGTRFNPCRVIRDAIIYAETVRSVHGNSHKLVYWPEDIPEGKKQRDRLRCRYCSMYRGKRNVSTRYQCVGCAVAHHAIGLCKKCYKPWHEEHGFIY